MSQHNTKAVELVRRHNGQILPFRSLPPLAKTAIRTRMEEESDREPKPNMKFGYVELPLGDLQDLIMTDLRADDAPFETFQDYHDWYVSQGDTPQHKTIWPIWLNLLDDGMGVIEDGSHRLHSYVRDGASIIPALFNPKEMPRK